MRCKLGVEGAKDLCGFPSLCPFKNCDGTVVPPPPASLPSAQKILRHVLPLAATGRALLDPARHGI